METLLVGGAFAQLLDVYSLDLANKEQLNLEQALPFCRQSKLGYEQILITGDGMAGLDDYTVNCAFILYFSDFYEPAEKDQDIACSLIRNLAKPQNCNVNSHHVDNLYIVTLAYSFSDKELLERFFASPKLINMLTVFRKHFHWSLIHSWRLTSQWPTATHIWKKRIRIYFSE